MDTFSPDDDLDIPSSNSISPREKLLLITPSRLKEVVNSSAQDKAKLNAILCELQPLLIQLEFGSGISPIREMKQKLSESITITPLDKICTDGLPKIESSDALDYDRYFDVNRVDTDDLVGCILVGLLSDLERFLELEYLYKFDRNTLELKKQGFKDHLYLLSNICR